MKIQDSGATTSQESTLFDWMHGLEDHDPIEIFSDNDFLTQGWPGNGSESNPFIIEGLIIRDPYISIEVWNTSMHFEIRRCILTQQNPHGTGGPALAFRNVTNGRVSNCFMNETTKGIMMINSTDFQITDSILFGNLDYAIYIADGKEVFIANNTIYDTDSGITLFDTTNVTIRDNRIYDCFGGLYLWDVQSCNITGNTIWRNYIGVGMIGGQSIITNNSIYGNENTGIRVNSGTASNIIYGNHIGWNGATNARDDSNSTDWDDSLGMGNWWSDWLGMGNYSIPGTANSSDQWPLLFVDNVNPVVDSPDDVDFEYGTKGRTVTWHTSDEYPLTYQIMRNGEITETGTWANQTITVQFDNLHPGIYAFTLQLWDAKGNYAVDQVSVDVSEAEAPIINSSPDIEYMVGDTGYNITWTPVDAYPDHYEVFMNGMLYDSGEWNGSEIVLVVDGHDVGVYNYSIVVYDTLGQNAMDTVFVEVLTPNYFLQVLFFIGIGMIGFIVTLSILYTSTPFLQHFKNDDDSEDEQEILAALEELSSDNDKSPEPRESTSLEEDDKIP